MTTLRTESPLRPLTSHLLVGGPQCRQASRPCLDLGLDARVGIARAEGRERAALGLDLARQPLPGLPAQALSGVTSRRQTDGWRLPPRRLPRSAGCLRRPAIPSGASSSSRIHTLTCGTSAASESTVSRGSSTNRRNA